MSVHVPPPLTGEMQGWEAVCAALETAPHSPSGWTAALTCLARLLRASGARIDAYQGAERWTAAATPGCAVDGERLAMRLWSTERLEFRLTLLGAGVSDAALELAVGRLAPAFGLAIRTQLTIEAEAVRMATTLLRRARLQPIVCGPDGEVLHGPEAAVLERLPLRLSGGRVTSPCRQDDARLRAALRDAAEAGREQVLVLGRDSDAPAVADVLPPLTGSGPCFRRHALILVRGRSTSDRAREPILQQLYGLTSAEAHVAVAVTDGTPVADIAARRGVAASTVRAQVKTVLAKVGVGRQVELVQRLAAVC